MLKVEINTMWKVAGRDLNWDEKWGWAGIGISSYVFNSPHEDLEIVLNETKQIWKVKKDKLVEFVKENGSTTHARGMKLGVVPIRLLDMLDPKAMPPAFKKVSEEDNKQQKLL